MGKPIVLIKTGGRVAENEEALKIMAGELKEMQSTYDFIFVHGGGKAVSEIQKTYGIEPVFEDGIRMTSETEMDLVDMGLAGLMNKKVVRLFSSQGLKAVGISGADGSLITGKEIAGKSCRTGKVVHCDLSLINTLHKENFLPVVSSVSSNDGGEALNINADEAALALGAEGKCQSILFISDIPGILDDKKVLKVTSEKEIYKLIETGVIKDGMIPKVQSSLEALHNGVKTVVIGEYKNRGDLHGLLSGEKGTKIWLK